MVHPVHFTPSSCVISYQQTGKVIGTGSSHRQTFLLDIGLGALFVSSADSQKICGPFGIVALVTYTMIDFFWYLRIDIWIPQWIKEFNSLLKFQCISCCSRVMFYHFQFTFHRPKAPLILFTLMFGPLGHCTSICRLSYRYHVTFIDDHSCFHVSLGFISSQ